MFNASSRPHPAHRSSRVRIAVATSVFVLVAMGGVAADSSAQAKPLVRSALPAPRPATVLPRTQVRPVTGYSLDASQQKYFGAIMQTCANCPPTSATGVLSGSLTNADVTSSTGDQFRGFGYQEEICVPNLTGGCVYRHTYGATIDWDFRVTGGVTYDYSIPFTVDYELPQNVFAGQRIYLAPTFTWDDGKGTAPTLTATQKYSFSHSTSVWCDAPFDGMDDLSASFTQYADKANVGVGIPVLPLFPSIHGNWDATFSPASTGGGNYGGSYTKLGGTGTLKNTGSNTFDVSPTSMAVYAVGTSPAAWKTGHEQFKLTATILTMIPSPPTVAAGSALLTARDIGEFALDTQLDGSIYRQDYVDLEISDLPYIDVPQDAGRSGDWKFENLPVKFKYRLFGVSTFMDYFGYDVSFDMRGIDRKNLLHDDVVGVPAGGVVSPWVDREGVFLITGSLPVVPRVRAMTVLAIDASQTLGVTAQPRSQQKIVRHDPPGVRLARVEDTRRVLRATRTVSLPRPTALRGTPEAGEYTVVLGAAAKARADEIVALLQSKGISAFVVARGGVTEMVVTLGAFTNQDQARQLAGMIKEIFKVDGDVVRTINEAKMRPLDDKVVQRLRAL